MKNLNLQTLTDKQLVAQFKVTKDNMIFGEIYNRHYQKVYNTCQSIVKDRDAAYDLVQDVMIKMMAHLPDLQHSNLLGFWIHRIAKNESINYYKNQNKKNTINTDECIELSDVPMDLEAIMVKENLLSSIEKCMDELKEEDRNLLKAKYFNNNSIEDLSQQFKLSSSAVKMRLARARNRIAVMHQKEQVVVL